MISWERALLRNVSTPSPAVGGFNVLSIPDKMTPIQKLLALAPRSHTPKFKEVHTVKKRNFQCLVRAQHCGESRRLLPHPEVVRAIPQGHWPEETRDRPQGLQH